MVIDKKITRFCSIALITLMAFTSCLDDKDNDDNNTINLSKQEIALRNMMLHGTWEGKLYYINTETHRPDSISTIWIGDSVAKTITFEHFPFMVLANYLDGEVKNKTQACNNQRLVFKYETPTNDLAKYSNMQYFWYGFTPVQNEASFIVDDKTATVKFVNSLFDQTSTYRPIITYYRKQLQGNILIGDLIYDNNTYNINRLLSITGTKIGK